MQKSLSINLCQIDSVSKEEKELGHGLSLIVSGSSDGMHESRVPVIISAPDVTPLVNENRDES
jgi:hypothetical protein